MYRLHYDRATRERILGEVAERDGFVQCHKHDLHAAVICRGYYEAVGRRGGAALRLAFALQDIGLTDIVEEVWAGDYPSPEEDDWDE